MSSEMTLVTTEASMDSDIQTYVSSHSEDHGYAGRIDIVTGPTGRRRWPEHVKAAKVTVEKRLGRDDQTAFAGLIGAAPEHWTDAHRLAGCAAIYLRLTYDPDAFPGGIPNITVDMEGKDDILDPRTDMRGYRCGPRGPGNR